MAHPLENAKWITCGDKVSSPIIKRTFGATAVKRATLFVTGIGYFEARVNGELLHEEKFLPVVSDYEPRDLSKFYYPLHDVVTNRVYFYEFDVTDKINDGENELSVQLGGGFYCQNERKGERTTYKGEMKAIYSLRIETENGVITLDSDGSETWESSEIVYNNLYIGEVHDPAAQRTSGKVQITDTETELSHAIGTADKIIRTIEPKLLGIVGTKKIYDAGENISGIVRIHTSAPKGEKIILRFAENLCEDGSLDFTSTGANCKIASGGPQIMRDVFVADGQNRTFEPKFTWHDFRYFEVEGEIDSAEVLVIHSAVNVVSEFNSSSEALNFIYDAFIRTQLNNMHGSIPSDCPHRERLGYTGDGQVCAPAAMMMLDSREFYRKWIRDILDSQCKVTGHVGHTAPLMGGGGGPGGWGSAIVFVPYAFYREYGEKELLSECYEPMRRYMDYLDTRSEDGIIVREEEKGWCLGDWCTLEKTIIPEAYVNTCYCVKMLATLCEIAHILGKDDDISAYEEKISALKEAIKAKFFDDETGEYCKGIQGASAYSVWAGLEGAPTAAILAKKYDELGHFDTGFLGTDILLEVLFDYGYEDVAFKLLESDELGSFLYMKNHGATTIWEDWDGKNSHNHPMFGACVRHFYTAILGIGRDGESVSICPKIPKKLSHIRGALTSPYGKIGVEAERKGEDIAFTVDIPANISACFAYDGEMMELHSGKNEILIRGAK